MAFVDNFDTAVQGLVSSAHADGLCKISEDVKMILVHQQSLEGLESSLGCFTDAESLFAEDVRKRLHAAVISVDAFVDGFSAGFAVLPRFCACTMRLNGPIFSAVSHDRSKLYCLL